MSIESIKSAVRQRFSQQQERIFEYGDEGHSRSLELSEGKAQQLLKAAKAMIEATNKLQK